MLSIEYKIMLFIKTFFMNISVALAIVKITNCKHINRLEKLKIILISGVISCLNIILYSIFKSYISPLLINIMVYLLCAYIVMYIAKPDKRQNIVVIIVSLSFAYIGLIVATMINFL